jgi:hypothetical protein
VSVGGARRVPLWYCNRVGGGNESSAAGAPANDGRSCPVLDAHILAPPIDRDQTHLVQQDYHRTYNLIQRVTTETVI